MSASSLSHGRRWGLASAILLLAGILGTCTDGRDASLTDPSEGDLTASLALAPEFDPALATEGAAGISRIRIVAYLAGTDSILGQTVQEVDPNADEWKLDVEVLVPQTPGDQVVLTVELLSVSGATETVEWSGKTEPFELVASTEAQARSVSVVRGPLDNVDVTSVVIDEPIPDVVERESLALTATAVSNDPNSTPRIFWTSLDPGIAVISTTGLLTGVAPGTARVVATAGSAADTANVTVLSRIAGVQITPESATLQSLGEEVQFTAQVVDPDGNPISGEGVSWGLESNTILQDLGGGLYRALARGSTVVTATSVSAPSYSAAADVTVQQAVDAVEVTPETATLTSPDQTVQYQARAFDANGNAIDGMTFAWSTSDETIATIDGTGVARGESAGTVTVFAAAAADVMTADGAPGSAGTSDGTPTPGTVGQATLVVQLGLDLAVAKTADTLTPGEGGTFTYLVVLTNHGPSNATNAVVEDRLPSGVQYVSHEATAGAYDPDSGLWTLPTQAEDASDTLRITVSVPLGTAGQSITNTASLSSVDETEENGGNNQASVTVTPTGIDVEVQKATNNDAPVENEPFTFTITALNHGPGDATNVVVTDPIPSGLTYLSHTPSAGAYDDATGLWSIPSLPRGQSATLSIAVKADPGTAGQSITNRASLSDSDQTDTNSANDEAEVTVTPIGVDLEVLKGVSNPTPPEGGQILFLVEVVNQGPVDATNVTVRDVLPAGLTYVSHTTMAGTYDPGTGDWDIPTVPAGGAEVLEIVVTVDPGTAGTTITNTAKITGLDQPDTNGTNDEDSADVTPIGLDIVIYKDVDVYDPAEGDQVTFTVKAENWGPADATNVVIQDAIPAGVTLVTNNTTAGPYDNQTGVWEIPSLPAGTSETLTITVSVDFGTAGTTITNTADLTAVDQTDEEGSNDTDQADIFPQGVDINVYKDVDVYDPAEGDQVTFTVKAENWGPADATNVVIQDAIPAGVTLVTNNTTAGPYDNQTGVWEIPSLPAGTSETLTITVSVDFGTAGTTITNTADLTAVDQTDEEGSNDTDQADIFPQGLDIQLAKAVDDASPGEGQAIVYTVTASNVGPSDATGVTIQDVLPTGVTLTGHTAETGTSYDIGTGVWTIGPMANGAVMTLTLDATVDAGTAGTTITNTATLTAVDQTDEDGGNDSASADITPTGTDIDVAKTVDVTNPNEGTTITYTVTVTNNGPADATNITVLDQLPAGVTIQGHNAGPADAAYDPATGVYSIGALAAGAAATLTIDASVDFGTAGTTITNTAELTGVDQTDEEPANDQSQIDIVPQGLDIQLAKAVDDASPGEGQAIVYTVTASNVGPSDATGVTIQDVLPTGVTLTGHTAETGTSYDIGTGVWTIGPMANGAVMTLTLDATVDAGTAGTTITNTATLTAVDQTDEDGGNDSASADINPLSAPQPRSYDTPGNTELITGAYTPPSTPHVVDPVNLLDGTPDLTVTSTGTYATTNGGSVTMEADGDFSYTPPAGDAGPDTFDYTVNTGATATVTVTMEDMVWYVNSASPTLPGTGVSNDPYETLGEAGTAGPAVSPPGPSSPAGAPSPATDGPQMAGTMGETVIFLYQGNSGTTPYTGGIILDASVRLQGEAAGLDLASFPGLVAPGGTPIIDNPGGDGVILGSGSTVRAVDIQDPSGAGIYASGISGATVDQVNISGTVAMGISLNNTTGTLDFTGVTVTDADNTALYVSGGDPTLTFDGSLVQNAANGHLYMFQVLNTTGGSVALNTGPFSDNDAASPAIFIDGAGGSVDVNQPVTIVSTADAGVTVQNSTAPVTFASLDIDNSTQIGDDGLRVTNNTGAVTVNNLDVVTSGGYGVYANPSTSLTINGGTVNTTDDAGIYVVDTQFDATFSSVSVANNTGGTGQGIYLQNTSPGTTSIGHLEVDVDVTSGAVYLSDAGTFEVTDPTSHVGATGVPAFQAINTDLNVVLDGAGSSAPTAAAGVAHGLYFFEATGTFSAASTGSITDPGNVGSAGIYVSGGNADITYKGIIGNTNADAWSVYVTGRTGGTLNLGGAITDGGRGIAIQSNDGGSVVFNGGMSLTGQGDGGVAPFYAYGVSTNGEVEVWNTKEDMVTPVSNTISPLSPSLDGTPGLQILNTTIGPNGVTFEHVSSNGATGISHNGIEVTNTGLGSFTITGDGSTAGSGGSLTNIEGDRTATGHGVVLTGVQDVSLSHMTLDHFHGSGVKGTDVTNFTFANSTLGHSGEPLQENQAEGMTFSGASGTLYLRNSTVEFTGEDCLQVFNSSGTLDIDIDGSTLNTCGTSDFFPGHGLNLFEGSATVTVDVINGSTIQNAERDGIFASVGSTASVGVKVDATGGQNTFDSNGNYGIRGNTSNQASFDLQVLAGGGNVNVFNLTTWPLYSSQTGDATVTFNIDGNTFTSGSQVAQFLTDENATASSTMEGQFINNTATGFNGTSMVRVDVAGEAQGTVKIDTNALTGSSGSGHGILGRFGNLGTVGAGSLDLNVTNNTVDLGPSNTGGTSITLSTNLDGTLCTNVDGNSIAASGYYNVEIARNGTSDQISLENQSGTASAFTDSFVADTYLPGQNPGADNNWVVTNTDLIQKVAPGTCGVPSLPSPPAPAGPGG